MLCASGEHINNWFTIFAYIIIKIGPKNRTDFDKSIIDHFAYYSYKALSKFCENQTNNVEARKVEDKKTSPPKSSDQRKYFLRCIPTTAVPYAVNSLAWIDSSLKLKNSN